MPYKKGIFEYQTYVMTGLSLKKETALLIKHNDEFRRMEEHIAYVEEIIDRPEGEMAIIKLRFAENKVVETKAYIDDTIQEKMLVSTWGFFDETQGKIRYFCKGGIQRVLLKATQNKEGFDLEKTYRMGFSEPSKIKISPTYLENKDIKPIADTGLYYFVGDISTIENSLENNSIVDVTGPKKRIKFY